MGAAFLGTGGGGDPYVGRPLAAQASRAHGEVDLIALSNVPDRALAIPVGNTGAPTAVVEKIRSSEEPLRALSRMEEIVGRSADAVVPFEAGGVNSTLPLAVAAERRLPAVDADGTGRAFPELQMEAFNAHGAPASPVAIVNEHGDSVVVEAHSSAMAEWLTRSVTIRMGGQASIAMYAMDRATAKRVSFAGTRSVIIRIGEAIRVARAQHGDPFEWLIEILAETRNRRPKILFKGKAVDVRQETKQGFAIGHVLVDGLDGWRDRMTITFQNENLIALVDDEARAIAPDLICILDSELAEPVATERPRYGQRVAVMGVAVASIKRAPEALEVFGPAAFGLKRPLVPVEELPN